MKKIVCSKCHVILVYSLSIKYGKCWGCRGLTYVPVGIKKYNQFTDKKMAFKEIEE